MAYDKFTAYDASVLGLVLRFHDEIDCSGLLANLSPDAKDVAQAILEPSKAKAGARKAAKELQDSQER